jgi:F0F1-type ATP synthase delta subunit
MKEVVVFNKALQDIGTFNPVTLRFIEVLTENKRLSFLSAICVSYQGLYKQLNREEKITVISAHDLNSSE